MFAIKFDQIISIGEDCACAMYLNLTGLRKMSFPFDWLTYASFKTRIDLIRTHFDTFLQRSNLEQIPKPTTGYVDRENDYYKDIATTFYFYHDFQMGVPLDETYPVVKEKYMRRIKRLYTVVQRAQNVLFVWWSRNKHLSEEELLVAQQSLSDVFGKLIYLLIIENEPGMSTEEVYLSPYVLKITADLMTNPTDPTTGNHRVRFLYFPQLKGVGRFVKS